MWPTSSTPKPKPKPRLRKDSLIQSCIGTENLFFIVSTLICNNLFKLKRDKDEKECLHTVFQGHGCDPKDSGVHSVGKGAATSVASASTAGPSMPAICNRCNWSRGACDQVRCWDIFCIDTDFRCCRREEESKLTRMLHISEFQLKIRGDPRPTSNVVIDIVYQEEPERNEIAQITFVKTRAEAEKLAAKRKVSITKRVVLLRHTD